MSVYADGALELRRDGGVARLTLSRPASRNALNLAMWSALPSAVAEVAADAGVRVLIVDGANGHFAAGADIAEFPQVFADRDAALAYGALLEAATGALAELDRPVIAQIHGFCIGAGLAIALACDLRLAASDARLGAPPAKLGLMYSLTDTRRLVNAVGASVARDMLFTAELKPAPEALRVGLVDEIHAPEALSAAVSAKAAAIAALSPSSVRRAKAVIGLVLAGRPHDSETTRAWFADATQGPDFAEGFAAFQARRPPVFSS